MNGENYFSAAYGTLAIISANILFFILLNNFSWAAEAFLLYPDISIMINRPWTLLTVFFSHELSIHLLLNMFLVIVFGIRLERITNVKTVLFTYFICGFFGSLSILLTAPLVGWNPSVPTVGASAAAFGLVAAFTFLQTDAKVLQSKAKYWLIALFAANAMITLFSPSVSIGGPAHAVGIAAGLAYGYLYKNQFVN
ncbi:rhomboid family intramembrane serine protease [Alkalicoccus halolimnae]|uniref:Rhomboid family intramembrane serine protease n=1 Tax=Alkalicoccus halolimnae TaxID=1667239 RepID=A0A5C7FGF7_9BACI|nr:rhomboid family intramembrane serine protease [Alkalicoccus halolimnae]TXF85354.1 rhomboid family intramembrane serine protease [Alkalicoccus halolimnae]